MAPTIERIEVTEFAYDVPDMRDYQYSPGDAMERVVPGIRVYADDGTRGGYVCGHAPSLPYVGQIDAVADSLIGENPLDRERIYDAVKRDLRKTDTMGLGPLDIALWDFAGRYYDAPVSGLLGAYRSRLPTQASTFGADSRDPDVEGALSSPEAYAAFASECRDRGFPSMKLHLWPASATDVDRDVETLHAVREAAGPDVDLMYDASCAYDTFADALTVGRACDEAGYAWYEDPYADAGKSQHGHRQLREFIDTPILMGEMIRGVEAHADLIENGATDILRVDPDYDGGITGTMKIAHLAEGFGIDVEIHAPGPAQRHCMAAIRNTNYYELALVHPEMPNYRELPVYRGYSDALDAIDADGAVPVPDGPGLGDIYDWSIVEDNAVRTWTYE